jgi:hypothetical protein
MTRQRHRLLTLAVCFGVGAWGCAPSSQTESSPTPRPASSRCRVVMIRRGATIDTLVTSCSVQVACGTTSTEVVHRDTMLINMP